LSRKVAVIDLKQFKNLRLHGGFVIKNIELTDDPIPNLPD